MQKAIKLIIKKIKKNKYILLIVIIYILLLILLLILLITHNFIIKNKTNNINNDLNSAKNINTIEQKNDGIDKFIPFLDVNNKDYTWKNEDIIIQLKTININENLLIYSKYIWNDKNGCAKHGNDYINNQEIILNYEGEHILYICNKDNYGNEYFSSFGPYKIDKTTPTINLDIPKTKLAGLNNFIVKFKLFDNINGKVNQISYDKYDVNYSYSIIGDNPQIVSGIKKSNLEQKDIYSLTDASEFGENFHLIFTITDKAGNSYTKKQDFKIYPNIITNNLGGNKSIITLNNIIGEKFANNSDTYEYSITLKDEFNNNIYNKNINLIKQDITGYNVGYTINTNTIDLDGPNALHTEFSSTIPSDNNGIFNFKLKSLAPGRYTQRFKIQMNSWGNDYIQNKGNIYILNPESAIENSFKKPFTGEIKVSNNNGVNWNYKPQIGSNQKYKIILNNDGNLINYSNGNLNISNSSFENYVNGHFWESFNNISNYFGNNNNNDIGFSALINANNNILTGPKIIINNLNISYNLGGKNIKYKLDKMEISGYNIETSRIKIIGTQKGDGKFRITGQNENFSEITKSFKKEKIKQNAYNLISQMTSGQIVNGIKFIEGDITISGNSNFETLIVKDGNVTISGDINIDDKKLGIIVLKDGYNTKTDYINKGNIYIDKDVTYINSIIYADGGVISSILNKPYTINSTDRTFDLRKQLILKGVILARNTIGGASLGQNSTYSLPGGNETNDFNNAMIYDLNYLRRGNTGCLDNNSDGICENYNEHFIIKYDSKIQANLPKGFY